MILKSVAEQVLHEALRTGGDFAELFCEDRRSGAMGLVDGHVESASTVRRHGAGIRVYNGLNSVYVHTNDTGLSGLLAPVVQAGGLLLPLPVPGDLHALGQVLRGDKVARRRPQRCEADEEQGKAYDDVSQVLTLLALLALLQHEAYQDERIGEVCHVEGEAEDSHDP